MKKNFTLYVLTITCFFLLFSAFIIHPTAATETLQQTTNHHHNLFKTSILTLGALGSAAFLRRRMRRHGGSMGCLGVLAIIGLVLLGIILLPIIVVALICAGIAALFGVRFERPQRRYRRRRERW